MLKNKLVLEINNVKKYYNSFLALNNISLKINSGELVVLLGPNGAGKSTLFSIITGLMRADSGACLINGYNIADNTISALKNLGVVFQQPTIDLELTVKQNLLFHSRLHGIDLNLVKKTIYEELVKTGLEKKINNKARTLSGGERRKVELIRSLLHKPKMLLMDEPTVGLDPGSRTDLLRKILNLKKTKSLSILWTTHLVDEAEKADKIIILNKGIIKTAGTQSEILSLAKEKNLANAFLKIVKGE
ncbi:MAG: Energy-coupling factor transporter ATP-binding protein EcfA2 [Alphaproteobacteria bacterium MarineAlpha9_Bin4]|nr:MAG: Energy-coupling factor transporter ATP-binding protein EcfA2 [Alphaproteobacteria bacterium MarineAlpha9_Bin4]